MRCALLGQSRIETRLLQGISGGVARERLVRSGPGEQPQPRLFLPPIGTQDFEQFHRQQREPLKSFERKILQIDESVQFAARLLVNLSEASGNPVRVTQGLRTYAEQDALYAQGRTTPGPIVTNARGGQSYHNFGLAIDVAPVQGGRANPRAYPSSRTVGIGKGLGFSWGGDFTSPFGLSSSGTKRFDGRIQEDIAFSSVIGAS